MIIFQLIDSFFVFNSLVDSGIPALEAMRLKGSFDRGLPIIQTATVFTSAIVSSTIPQMVGLKDIKQRKKVFNFALFLIILLSIPACVGLYNVVDELNITLFKDNNGIEALRILTLQILFYPFTFLSTAIMQQEGQYSKLLVSVLAGIFVKLTLTAPLTTQLGISGTAIASVAGLVMMSFINLLQFRKMLYRQSIFNLIKVSFATVALWMTLDYLAPQIPNFLSGLEDVRVYNFLSLVIQVSAGVMVYAMIMGIFLLTTKATSKGRRKRQKKKVTKKATKKIIDSNIL